MRPNVNSQFTIHNRTRALALKMVPIGILAASAQPSVASKTPPSGTKALPLNVRSNSATQARAPEPVDAITSPPALIRAITELRLENAQLRERAREVDAQLELIDALRTDNMSLRGEVGRLHDENARLRGDATEASLLRLRMPPPPPLISKGKPSDDENKENGSHFDACATAVVPFTDALAARVFNVLSDSPFVGEDEDEDEDEDEEAMHEEAADAVDESQGWSAEVVALVARQAEQMVIFSDAGAKPMPHGPTAAPKDADYDQADYAPKGEFSDSDDEGVLAADSDPPPPLPPPPPPPSTPWRRRAAVVLDDDDEDEEAAVLGQDRARRTPGSRRQLQLSDDEDHEEEDPDEKVAPMSAKAPAPRSLAEPRQGRRERRLAGGESDDEDDAWSTDGSDEGSDLDGFIVPDEDDDPDYEEGSEDEEDEDEDEDDEDAEGSCEGSGEEGRGEDVQERQGKHLTSTKPSGRCEGEKLREKLGEKPLNRETGSRAARTPHSESRWAIAAANRAVVVIDVDEDEDVDVDVDEDEGGRAPDSRPPVRTPARGGTPAGSGAPTPRSQASMQRRLHELAPQLYAEYNAAVFGGALPVDLPITWNPRLLRTAGQCAFRGRADGSKGGAVLGGAGGLRTAAIELSSKVLDSEARLRGTRAHESALTCH
jgi:hypothetical protein